MFILRNKKRSPLSIEIFHNYTTFCRKAWEIWGSKFTPFCENMEIQIVYSFLPTNSIYALLHIMYIDCRYKNNVTVSFLAIS